MNRVCKGVRLLRRQSLPISGITHQQRARWIFASDQIRWNSQTTKPTEAQKILSKNTTEPLKTAAETTIDATVTPPVKRRRFRPFKLLGNMMLAAALVNLALIVYALTDDDFKRVMLEYGHRFAQWSEIALYNAAKHVDESGVLTAEYWRKIGEWFPISRESVTDKLKKAEEEAKNASQKVESQIGDAVAMVKHEKNEVAAKVEEQKSKMEDKLNDRKLKVETKLGEQVSKVQKQPAKAAEAIKSQAAAVKEAVVTKEDEVQQVLLGAADEAKHSIDQAAAEAKKVRDDLKGAATELLQEVFSPDDPTKLQSPKVQRREVEKPQENIATKGTPVSDVFGELLFDLENLSRRHPDAKSFTQLSDAIQRISTELGEARGKLDAEAWKSLQGYLKQSFTSAKESLELATSDINAAVESAKKKAADEASARMEFQKEELEEAMTAALEEQSAWLHAKFDRSLHEALESERSGRLARLDHLAMSVKKLSAFCMENVRRVEESARLRTLAQTLAGIRASIFNTGRQASGPLNLPWSMLQSQCGSDSFVEHVLAAVPAHTVEDGVRSHQSLQERFCYRVAPQLRKVALLPAFSKESIFAGIFEKPQLRPWLPLFQQAFPSLVETDETRVLPPIGLISYGQSWLLSKLMAPSVRPSADGHAAAGIERAEDHLNHGNVENAMQEVIRLNGWPRMLSEDWLEEARRYLEVQMALDVMETYVTLKEYGKL